MESTSSQSDSPSISPRIRDAAEKLCQHIRSSRLRRGDRYISADEASTLLGESVMTAQRAMSYLASKHVLERRSGSGTFIGHAADDQSTATCVHFVYPEQCLSERAMRDGHWDLVQGMRDVLTNASFQCHFLPHRDDPLEQQLFAKDLPGAVSGAVLVLSSRSMRAHFNHSGVPTIVRGNVEDDLNNLCWVSFDEHQTGELLASWLVERGHKRVVTIMRDVWSIGEHQLTDSVGRVLSQAGLSADALLVRSTPAEKDVIAQTARQVLVDRPDISTGFICRTAFQADCVMEVARSLGLGDRVDVTKTNVADIESQPNYTCVVPEINGVEQGRIMANMFQTMAEARMPDPRGMVVGVKLSPVDR